MVKPAGTEAVAAEPVVAQPSGGEAGDVVEKAAIAAPTQAGSPVEAGPVAGATAEAGAVYGGAAEGGAAEGGAAEGGVAEGRAGAAVGVRGDGRTEAWAKLVADPGHAPELLALAAVQAFGPKARDWAARTRESYPAAGDRAVARLAARQFARLGGWGSVFGAVAGSYTPVTLLGAAAVTHAQLVLHVAAAYGLDPADPERAVDLLVITRVHPSRADARAALAAARRPTYDQGGLSDAAWRFGRMLVSQTGGWTALRLANRVFPGASLLAAILAGTASAQTVAARAESYYRDYRDYRG
ncbi:hypothetical protein [Paractinoplanes ferrugineus]|uniref:EcsC family protein n=1 Tax=Paractinoplanes ferrugineus TaxID=113564 RepID=A0A919J0V8_9ACTN|nr:hypothetical protein [Actinoplanes ferrugineus]GIE11975.1 hypothetical protein Afe05nite_38150 [Actinoplanes ferrugineus]